MTKKEQPPRCQTNKERKYISHITWHNATGEWPQEGEVIHHIDEDPFNNKLDNLQLMTISEHTSLHNKGKTFSKEHKAKISAYAKTRTGEKNAFYGKEHSEETKAKMSASKIGNKNPNWKGKSGKANPFL